MTDETSIFIRHLTDRLTGLKLTASTQQLEQLAGHFRLLRRFARIHNLTTIVELDQAIDYHYVDCLQALSLLQPSPTLMDVGSGAGFPGLLAAIMWPSTQVTLVESVRKKCSFLRAAAAECGLKNVTVLNQNFFAVPAATHVITRATFPPGQLIKVIQALAPQGQLTCLISAQQIDLLQRELLSIQLAPATIYRYTIGAAHFAVGLIHQQAG